MPRRAVVMPLAVQATARRSSRVVTHLVIRPRRRCGGGWEDTFDQMPSIVSHERIRTVDCNRAWLAYALLSGARRGRRGQASACMP